jgi:L-amino acid N-acyltransferase YncA
MDIVDHWDASCPKTAPFLPDYVRNREHMKTCRLVAVNDQGAVVGWAALTPVSSRCVYRGVAEVSVYVALRAQGLGIKRV